MQVRPALFKGHLFMSLESSGRCSGPGGSESEDRRRGLRPVQAPGVMGGRRQELEERVPGARPGAGGCAFGDDGSPSGLSWTQLHIVEKLRPGLLSDGGLRGDLIKLSRGGYPSRGPGRLLQCVWVMTMDTTRSQRPSLYYWVVESHFPR